MKKFFPAILAALIVSASVTSLPFSAGAASVEQSVADAAVIVSGDYSVEYINDTEAKITAYNGTDADVVIPESINGYKIVAIGDSAFYQNQSISSVVIPEGVKAIEANAFNGCRFLETVSVPSTVKEFGEQAFVDCYWLKDVTIPEGVTALPSALFQSCYSLKTITLPSTLTSIGDSAFYHSALQSVSIPDGVKTIGMHAFSSCDLTSVELPSALTKISDYTFWGCSSLESVTIPDGVNTIGSGAFEKCFSLKNIKLPSNITSIESESFRECENLKGISIPSPVTTIGYNAFAFCKNLENVTLNNALKEIGYGAFSNCETLKKVEFPSTVKEIGEEAFSYCTALETITFGNAIEAIGSMAFEGTKWENSLLEKRGKATYIGKCFYKYIPTESEVNNGFNMTVKDGTKCICVTPFSEYAEALNAIVLPASVTTIETGAFERYYRCANLKDVYYLGTEEQWTNVYVGSRNDCFNEAAFHCNYGHSVSAPKMTKMTNSNNGITLTWNAVDGASRYRVFRKTAGSSWKAIGTVGATTFTDKTAVPGETYYYTLRCVSTEVDTYISGYNTKGWKTAFVSAPVLEKAENVYGGVKVSWEATVGASEYKVYRKTDGTSWKSVGTASGTSFTDKTAVSGETYYYTVRAVLDADSSTYLSTYSQTGLKVTYCAAPVLKPLTNTPTGVKISWNKSDAAERYMVYQLTKDGAWESVGETADTSFIHTGVQSGESYTYTVVGVNGDGAVVSGYNQNGKTIQYIAAPVFTKFSNSATGTKLVWSAPDGAVNYRVYRLTDAGVWKSIGDTTETTFIDTDVVSGEIYTYTVKCMNASGTEAASGFYNNGKKIKFIAPPTVSSITKSSGSLTVNWSRPAGSTNRYIVFKKTNGSSWKAVATTTKTGFTDTDVTAGKTYAYAVRVLSADGNTYLSSYVSSRTVTF